MSPVCYCNPLIQLHCSTCTVWSSTVLCMCVCCTVRVCWDDWLDFCFSQTADWCICVLHLPLQNLISLSAQGWLSPKHSLVWLYFIADRNTLTYSRPNRSFKPNLSPLHYNLGPSELQTLAAKLNTKLSKREITICAEETLELILSSDIPSFILLYFLFPRMSIFRLCEGKCFFLFMPIKYQMQKQYRNHVVSKLEVDILNCWMLTYISYLHFFFFLFIFLLTFI